MKLIIIVLASVLLATQVKAQKPIQKIIQLKALKSCVATWDKESADWFWSDWQSSGVIITVKGDLVSMSDIAGSSYTVLKQILQKDLPDGSTKMVHSAMDDEGKSCVLKTIVWSHSEDLYVIYSDWCVVYKCIWLN
jgi:hypothetical protein